MSIYSDYKFTRAEPTGALFCPSSDSVLLLVSLVLGHLSETPLKMEKKKKSAAKRDKATASSSKDSVVDLQACAATLWNKVKRAVNVFETDVNMESQNQFLTNQRRVAL